MLTKNGKLAFGSNSSSGIQFKSITGENVQITPNNAKTNADLWIGNGTTPATVNDYAMESRITTLTKSGQTLSRATTYGDDFIELLTATFFNSTGSDVTVSELGWITAVNTTSYETGGVVIVHEVFTPVVIPNGEAKTFTIQIG